MALNSAQGGGGLGGSKGGPKALVTLNLSVWKSQPVGKWQGRGEPWKQGLSGCLGVGRVPTHLMTLPLTMEKRARIDIIFY